MITSWLVLVPIGAREVLRLDAESAWLVTAMLGWKAKIHCFGDTFSDKRFNTLARTPERGLNSLWMALRNLE